MRKLLAITALLLCFSGVSIGQMSLAHHYPGTNQDEGAMVNLSRSGKKILKMQDRNGGTLDTLFFYNLDYSFWKMIPCPAIPGYRGLFNFYHEQGQSIGVFYPSETLFNLDTFLEVGVTYYLGSTTTKLYVINELGNIVDSILNLDDAKISGFHVAQDSSGAFKAFATTRTGLEIYNLPGTLPCETCVTPSLGTAMTKDQPNNIITQPIPNPSKDEVKITFTLPEGSSRGELQLFSNTGVRIKTCQVDNRFGFIMLDNSLLPPGLYYYNIVVNGVVSSSQKLLVVK